MNATVEDVRAVLNAYKQVKDASWPALHPGMAERASRWPAAPLEELNAEMAGYLAEASRPSCRVRIFWKMGREFRFAGCNEHFAHDAGLPSADIIGIDDFDARLPWRAQASKYRSDDQEVFDKGEPKLDILERQGSAAGITWVHVGKTPIRAASGEVLGILGMYEVLDNETGTKLYIQRQKAGGR
jgi:hypothetical protein